MDSADTDTVRLTVTVIANALATTAQTSLLLWLHRPFLFAPFACIPLIVVSFVLLNIPSPPPVWKEIVRVTTLVAALAQSMLIVFIAYGISKCTLSSSRSGFVFTLGFDVCDERIADGGLFYTLTLIFTFYVLYELIKQAHEIGAIRLKLGKGGELTRQVLASCHAFLRAWTVAGFVASFTIEHIDFNVGRLLLFILFCISLASVLCSFGYLKNNLLLGGFIALDITLAIICFVLSNDFLSSSAQDDAEDITIAIMTLLSAIMLTILCFFNTDTTVIKSTIDGASTNETAPVGKLPPRMNPIASSTGNSLRYRIL